MDCRQKNSAGGKPPGQCKPRSTDAGAVMIRGKQDRNLKCRKRSTIRAAVEPQHPGRTVVAFYNVQQNFRVIQRRLHPGGMGGGVRHVRIAGKAPDTG